MALRENLDMRLPGLEMLVLLRALLQRRRHDELLGQMARKHRWWLVLSRWRKRNVRSEHNVGWQKVSLLAQARALIW